MGGGLGGREHAHLRFRSVAELRYARGWVLSVLLNTETPLSLSCAGGSIVGSEYEDASLWFLSSGWSTGGSIFALT